MVSLQAITTANNTVPGLQRLICLETVSVHQKRSGFSGNKYTVHSDGEVLFTLKEDGHALTFLSDGKTRGFRMNGVDNMGRKVFTLRRPTVMCSGDKVKLYMDDTLVSVIRKEFTFMTALFLINDAHDSTVLRAKGDFARYKFQLQTADKRNIGMINKVSSGLLREIFTYRDDYAISFPVDLDVRFKLAAIATCIFIDYRYHES